MLHWRLLQKMPIPLPVLPLSLYIHIPWCIKKCPYCDFNSHAVKSSIPEEKYISALLSDLSNDLQQYRINRPLSSIFIGGGTPSLFQPKSIDRLLRGIEQQIAFIDEMEITLEANPGTFESHKFSEFRNLGVNRLSIGIQSFNDKALTALGRVHNAQQAKQAVEIAHHSGFENFNLDLMFGLPDSSMDVSEQDIETAICLNPAHISCYQLTLEPNTYFHKFPPRLPGDDECFTIQTHCQQKLAQKGFVQYEISAYSLPDKQCRHNLNYWQFGDYLGIGAGAHGKITESLPNRIIRSCKYKYPDHYLKSGGYEAGQTVISQTDLPLEFIMNHLRLKRGFSVNDYQSSTGLSIDTLEPELSNNIQQGLLSHRNERYACSEQGWHFLDTILQSFVVA